MPKTFRRISALFKEGTWLPVIAVLLGLASGALIMLLGSYNPLTAYQSLLTRSFGDMYNFGEMIRQVTPLIFTGLAVAFAFRTGLFNIGAEGQFIIGAMAGIYVGVFWHLPWGLHAVAAVAAGALAGGIWGGIAGYLKAARGVHEVISTIMLNWIALYLVNYLTKRFMLEPGQMRSRTAQESAWLSADWLSGLFEHARIHFGILIGLGCAVVFYIVLLQTKLGFELRAVGLNPHASEYAGIKVKQSMIAAMFGSGMFAGLGGAAEMLGVYHYLSVEAAFRGYGFLGLAVALIGRNTALGTVLSAFLLGALTYGAPGMKFGAGVPEELIDIVIAMVIFFVAAAGIITAMLRLLSGRRRKKEAA
ncbi:ABC transporter permease [Xylanibacillus composti]|nr:ABC transporter permease [Xylanibacillus composti]MDT9726016.1 ABC transporter permease [Xylanibacillus composti]